MEYLSAAEVAKRFGVHKNTVLNWIRAGHFPGTHKRGPGKSSPYIVPLSAVIALEEKLQAGQPS